MTLDEFVQTLRDHDCKVTGHGNAYKSTCPSHDDNDPSLSIGPGTGDAPFAYKCHAGCTKEEIRAALGLPDSRPASQFKGKPKTDWIARYEYTDERGGVLYVKERGEPKTFRIYRPLTGGRRRYQNVFGGADAPRRVLYRLHTLAGAISEGRTIHLVEGEKDVHSVEKAGGVATCNYEGAAKGNQRPKWRPEYGDTLKGAHVVIVADKDEPGRAHAAAARADLTGKAASVKVVEAKEGKDFTDHVRAGYGLDDLVPVADNLLAAGAVPAAAPAANTAVTDDDSKGRGPSQASQLAALARQRYDLFMSEDGRPYAVSKQGATTVFALRGKAGLRSRLAREFADANGGSVPSQSALADAMTVLEGVAADAEPQQLHIRVARHDDRIIVDLATPEGRCVSIGPDGWHREATSPVLFRRSGAMKPLPEPIRDGDGLAKLQGLLNTDEEGFHLLVAWLVACFIPDLPHPILTFRGEQGTGKSYAAKMVIGIIDPSGAPKRTAPRDLKAWATQAFNSWALCLDNVSVIADWLSDALCRAVTGDGIVDRALYTDDDVVVLEFRRVLAMTTIDAGALAGDLAERLVTIELHTIPDAKRREENEMDAAYADAHASILASLFDLLVRVLKQLPDVVLTERPRMADFARILAAVDHVQGWNTMASYKASARDAVADVLDGEPFAQAVVSLVDRAGTDGLTLTTQQILDSVATPDKLPKKWPKDSTRAGGQLKRLAPALRTIGIEVDDSQRGPAPKRQRLYKLTATAERRSAAASTASSTDEKAPVTSADGVDAGMDALASTPTLDVDAVDADMDAGLFPASTPDIASDLREAVGVDAGDAMDAAMRPLSDLPLCAVCDFPFEQLEPGQTTHPGCAA